MLHHEGDGITAFATAEVLKNTLRRNYIKRGSFLIRKWAERLVILPRPLQGDEITDHINDVDPTLYFIYGVTGDQLLKFGP